MVREGSPSGIDYGSRTTAPVVHSVAARRTSRGHSAHHPQHDRYSNMLHGPRHLRCPGRSQQVTANVGLGGTTRLFPDQEIMNGPFRAISMRPALSTVTAAPRQAALAGLDALRGTCSSPSIATSDAASTRPGCVSHMTSAASKDGGQFHWGRFYFNTHRVVGHQPSAFSDVDFLLDRPER